MSRLLRKQFLDRDNFALDPQFVRGFSHDISFSYGGPDTDRDPRSLRTDYRPERNDPPQGIANVS
jgi:hypothetical protein